MCRVAVLSVSAIELYVACTCSRVCLRATGCTYIKWTSPSSRVSFQWWTLRYPEVRVFDPPKPTRVQFLHQPKNYHKFCLGITMSNLTAVLYGINDLRLEDTPIKEPGDDEVLLEMGCVGICGSDVHYLTNGRIGDYVVTTPMIIGHESSGTVIKLGKNVKNLKVGNRVAVEPGVPCRTCKFCKGGRYNLCPDIVFCATPPFHGSLRRYYNHAADFCFKLPDNVSLEEGAMLEPLSVGVHACKRGNVGLGSTVLILGAGPIGLVTLLAAKAMGASRIVITDIVQGKLDVAKTLGADAVYLVQKNQSEEEVVKQVKNLFGGEGPDKSIDASGAQSSIRLGVLATKPGGVVVLVGLGAPEIQIPIVHAATREIDIRGVFRYVNDYADALDLVATGKVNVKPLITNRFTIEDTIKAFDTSKSGAPGVIKVMINVRS